MKTAEEIFNEMKTLFAENSGYEITDGCDMAVRMYAAASQTEALYIYGSWILRQCFPQTAEGIYLDSHGVSRGIVRKEGTKAKGELCFTVKYAAVNDILIPSGTVCMTASGAAFKTLDSAVIAEGEKLCTVSAEALEVGKSGNAAKRTITYMTNPPVGVEMCVNPAAFTGGENAESDEALRERILRSYKAVSNGANSAWYEKTALEVAGVKAVSVVPCPRGVGTVDVVITSEDGVPSDELLAQVQSVFEEKREICVDVSVVAPQVLYLNIEADVKVKSGYNATEVIEAVKAELENMFDGSLISRKLYRAEIGDRIYHVNGVESYKIIAPDYDVQTYDNALLCAGDIKISRWE